MRRTFPLIIIATLLLIDQLWSATKAQPDSIQPKYYLQEIVITQKKIIDPPFSYTEVSAKQIEAHRVNNLGEALRIVNGISIRANGSKGISSFYLRGFDQRAVVLMVDGRPIYEPYFGSMDLSQIPVAQIAKIKIIKGPASTLYGANTLGGAINIITKSALTTPTTDIYLDYRSGNNYAISAQHGRSVGPLNLWLSFNGLKNDGYLLSQKFEPTNTENGGLRNNSDQLTTNWDTKIGWQFGKQGAVDFSLGFLNSSKGIPPSVSSTRPRFWRFTDWDKHYFDLSGFYRFFSFFQIKSKLYQDYYDNTLVSYTDDSYQSPRWVSKYKNRVSGGMVQLSVNNKKHDVTIGLHLKKDRVHIQSDTGEPWNLYDAQTLSLAIQEEFRLHYRLNFLAGISYDHLKGFSEWNQSIFGPQLGAVFRPSNRISLHFLIGKKSRFPSLKEWHESIVHDVWLKPEQAITIDLGMNCSFGKMIHSEFSIFSSKVTDLITRQERYEPFRNLNASRLRGAELSVSVVPSSFLQTRFSYHYLDAIDLESHQQLEYRPKHNFSLSGQLTTLKNIKLNLFFNYVSKRYYYDQDQQLYLDDYYLINININKKISDLAEIVLSCFNLMDNYYEDEEGFPLPGREFSVGIKFKY